jgi:hypothetical protein
MKSSLKIPALFLAFAFLSGCTSAPAADISSAPPPSSPAAIHGTASPQPAATPTPAATVAPVVTEAATPTPSPTPTAIPQLEYKYDPTVVPSDAKAYLGADYKDYKSLVEAILARQQVIVFDNKAVIPKVMSCFYAEFPLTFLLSGDYKVDKKGRTLTLTYRYDAGQHKALVKAFQTRVTDVIQSVIQPQYNPFERMLALYRFTAQNISYVNGDDVSPYNALMNGVGICQSYDGVLRFLLLQVGIDGISGDAFVTDGAAHVWSMVKVNGAWFHLDPTFENSTTGGAGLVYFGMNDSRRVDSGVKMPISTGINEWWKPKAPACKSDRFAAFVGVTRWELDSEKHILSLYYADSAEPVKFDTVKLAVYP